MYHTTSVFNWSFPQIPTSKPNPLLGSFYTKQIYVLYLLGIYQIDYI